MWLLILGLFPILPLLICCTKSPPMDKDVQLSQKTSPRKKTTPQRPKAEKTEKSQDKSQKQLEISEEDNRTRWANSVVQMKCRNVAAEYTDKAKTYVAPDQTYNAHSENQSKNRYPELLCADQTRVVLKGKGKDDYIHASWMITPGQHSKYICTQAPLTETCEDFWCMVMQEEPSHIVMLCRLIEFSTEKCVQYWPDKKGQIMTFGSIKVTNIEQSDLFEEVVQSTLELTNKDAKVRVSHLFVKWWPDQLAPIDPRPMLMLCKWLKEKSSPDVPIVVHCSAGVGRTGTFIGLDYALIRIQENSNTSLIDVVKEMRAQRYQSVQTHVQFLFLHVCLIELFYQDGLVKKEGRIKEFIEEYQRHATRKLTKQGKEDA